jgi:hypothetical protein
MDPALAGVIGAAVGAAAGVTGALITVLSQARTQRLTTQQQRRADGYAKAVEHLYRAAVRRSEITAEGLPILSREDTADWFLDLADALNSLTVVIAYAGSGFRAELAEVLQHYGQAVYMLTEHGTAKQPDEAGPYVGLKPFLRWKGELPSVLWEAAVTVQRIATRDLSGLAPAAQRRKAT